MTSKIKISTEVYRLLIYVRVVFDHFGIKNDVFLDFSKVIFGLLGSIPS